jgi:ribose transport system ATP-binding protein
LDTALHAQGLTKRYGGITALEEVGLTLRDGEVHALLGANGAGKSTLVKILAGIVQPDEGTLSLRGAATRLPSPQAAFRAGIATVHQELSLFPGLTVAQNVLIGREPRNRLGWIDEAALLETTKALLADLGVEEIAPDTPVSELSLAQQQLVEITKAMSFDPRVLILDEPTSALGRADVDRLLGVVRGLRQRGRAIVFISHRMEEIESITDQVTILRGGRKVGEMTRAQFDRDHALELMLGDTQLHLQRLHPAAPPPGAALLEVRDLTLAGRLAGVDFDIRPGEVLGLAGLEGHGQRDMLFALFGLYRRGLRGDVRVRGRPARATRPLQAIASGFALIPDDRKGMGGFLELSVAHNISATLLRQLTKWGMLDRGRERSVVADMITRLRIKCDSPDAPLASLSGGNQQKVVTAKWLAHGASIYLFCDPTRGVDAGAREILYAAIRDLAAAGNAILVYSTDINEFVILCTRVLVMRDGSVSGTLSGRDITEPNILAMSFRDLAQAA